MTNIYAKALPVPKPKRLPRKCSTCADRDCRQRGRVCDWRHCGKWRGEERVDGKRVPWAAEEAEGEKEDEPQGHGRVLRAE